MIKRVVRKILKFVNKFYKIPEITDNVVELTNWLEMKGDR